MVVAGGLCGMPILPIHSYHDQTLRYPVGGADLEYLTGRPFNIAAFTNVPQFLYQGECDTSDAVQFPDAYDAPDRDLINQLLGETPIERWAVCETIVTHIAPRIEFHIDPGAAHQTSPAMGAQIKAFIQKHIFNP
ncbi:MAG: hypothetical protein EOM20_10025 [Spartobacteria bacterium]|nr:hypothetical protein [Spartobacteria bacterium]